MFIPGMLSMSCCGRAEGGVISSKSDTENMDSITDLRIRDLEASGRASIALSSLLLIRRSRFSTET
jgi:hypothetical protein